MKRFIPPIIAILICEAVGLLSTPFTLAAIPTWYAYLQKGPLNPPNWVFGPVWNTLYALMGISVYLIWAKKSKGKKEKAHRKQAFTIFSIQLIFNFLWSVVFFYSHNILGGLLDIVILWLTILLTIIFFYRISRLAAYLLLPYLAWVSFATYLNYTIWILNR